MLLLLVPPTLEVIFVLTGLLDDGDGVLLLSVLRESRRFQKPAGDVRPEWDESLEFEYCADREDDMPSSLSAVVSVSWRLLFGWL